MDWPARDQQMRLSAVSSYSSGAPSVAHAVQNKMARGKERARIGAFLSGGQSAR